MATRLPPKPLAPLAPLAPPTPRREPVAPRPREPGRGAPARGADAAKAELRADAPDVGGAGLDRAERFDRRGDGARREVEPGAEAPRARVGEPDVAPAELGGMSVLLATEHVFRTLAARRATTARAALLAEVAETLVATERPEHVRKILFALADLRRIVDIYPLELMYAIVDARPGWLEGVEVGRFVLNRATVEATRYAVEAPVVLELPLQAKLKGMALVGGGSPGYHLYPSGLKDYTIELGAAGRFTFLLRAEVRRTQVIDQVTLDVAPDPS